MKGFAGTGTSEGDGPYSVACLRKIRRSGFEINDFLTIRNAAQVPENTHD
jgi:hypothetical protein